MRRSAKNRVTPLRHPALHCFVFILCLGAFLILPGPSFAHRATVIGATDAVVVAPAGAAGDGVVQATVAAAGGRVDVVVSTRVALCRVDAEAARRLHADGFAVLRAGAAPPPDAPAGVNAGLSAIDRLGEAVAGDPLTLQQGLKPIANDVRQQSIDQAAGLTPPSDLGMLPSATEPDAFAAGSVAVSVIFVESNGTIDPDTEDWSQARIDAVQAKIDAALTWWSTRSPGAGLTFVLPPSGALGAPAVDPTGYEAINRSSLDDGLWRHQIMQSLGFSTGSSDNPPPEVSYDNAVREANHTDWAFTVYVVDDNNGYASNGGMFPDGAFAYTFDLFGPYMVMTYHNDGYGPGLFDAVMVHEMGHVFGALDEYAAYAGYPSTGDLYSGYLWVKNRNADVGGTYKPRFPCIMEGGNRGVTAYGNDEFDCPATRGQVGWRDSDNNGTPDVIDTTPTLTLGAQTQTGGAVAVPGTTHENPWPHGSNASGEAFTHNISVFVPHDVQYSVDGGSWAAVTANDGSFDEPSENVTVTTPVLGDGPDVAAPTHHTLTVQATTGNTTTVTRDIWSGTTQPVLTLDTGGRSSRTITAGKSASLHVVSASGGYPIPDLAVQLERSGIVARTLSTDAAGVWTGTVSPTTRAVYEADFTAADVFLGAQSGDVTINVRPLITVTRGVGPITLSGRMSVACTFRPVRKGVTLQLQESRNGGASWKTVAAKRTGSTSNATFSYHPTHRGKVLLRVLFAGDAKNVKASTRVPVFTVL